MSGGSPAELIALIPAAGFATRMGELPCSKEILPVGWRGDRRPSAQGVPEGKPLVTYLLDRLAMAGIRRALVITRREKSDIARYLGTAQSGVDLEYLPIARTTSTVATLDAAYERVRGSNVALGFPDIVFEPRDAYRQVIEEWRLRGTDVALGLFPSDQPERSDMVELSPRGAVERLVIKQPDRGLTYTWSIAIWTPAFTEYLHERLDHPPEHGGELYVGDIIQSALDSGLAVAARVFAGGASADLGTPRALAQPPDWVMGS